MLNSSVLGSRLRILYKMSVHKSNEGFVEIENQEKQLWLINLRKPYNLEFII